MGQSIRDIVNSINDPGQLQNARELIDSKLKAYFEQRRILVWEVEDKAGYFFEVFKGDDYVKAVDFMYQQCLKLKDSDDVRKKQISITPRFWLESEFNDYFGLNGS